MPDSPNVLTAFSDALAGAVVKAGNSTVLVNGRRRIPASGIIWAGGIVVTASHVLERDDGLLAGLPGGGEVEATLAGRDPASDIAVLRLATGANPAIERAGPARVGSLALAVGRPAPGGPMASIGIVSAVGPVAASGQPAGGEETETVREYATAEGIRREVRVFRGGHHAGVEGAIRSDVTFYPGFSGGPLVDAAGSMLGLNTSWLGRGAGLTVPTTVVERVAAALIARGKIARGFLGVGSQPVRLQPALSSKLSPAQETGLLIVAVEEDSPAGRAGLIVGDILCRLGGAVIADTGDLQARLGPESPGTTVTVTVLRGGDPKDLLLTIGERV